MSIESEIIELIADELKGCHEIELLESKVNNLTSTAEELEGSVAELEYAGKDFVETWQFEEVESTVTDLAEDVRKLEQKLKTEQLHNLLPESEIRRVVDKRLRDLLMDLQLSIIQSITECDTSTPVEDGDKPSDDLGPNSLPPVEVSE